MRVFKVFISACALLSASVTALCPPTKDSPCPGPHPVEDVSSLLDKSQGKSFCSGFVRVTTTITKTGIPATAAASHTYQQNHSRSITTPTVGRDDRPDSRQPIPLPNKDAKVLQTSRKAGGCHVEGIPVKAAPYSCRYIAKACRKLVKAETVTKTILVAGETKSITSTRVVPNAADYSISKSTTLSTAPSRTPSAINSSTGSPANSSLTQGPLTDASATPTTASSIVSSTTPPNNTHWSFKSEPTPHVNSSDCIHDWAIAYFKGQRVVQTENFPTVLYRVPDIETCGNWCREDEMGCQTFMWHWGGLGDDNDWDVKNLCWFFRETPDKLLYRTQPDHDWGYLVPCTKDGADKEVEESLPS